MKYYYKKEYEKFKNNLKNKISKDLDIPSETIIVTYPKFFCTINISK